MLNKYTIDWNKLATVEELQEFFEEDFQGFKKLIEDNIEEFEKFSDSALDKLAKLRVLEVTNGCTQWAFRLGDKECYLWTRTNTACINISQARL